MDTLFYSITSPVQAMRVYDTGFAFLLNDKGRIIFHPSISAGKTPEEISIGLSANMFQEPNNGNHLIRYKMNGEERQLSFSTLSNGMKLVVTAPVAEIFLPGGRRPASSCWQPLRFLPCLSWPPCSLPAL